MPGASRVQSFGKFLSFSLAALAAWFAPGPIIGTTGAMLGIRGNTPLLQWAYIILANLLLLALTWVALRWDRESFATLGLSFNRGRLREFGMGLSITTVLFLATALVRAEYVGAEWRFAGAAGIRVALMGVSVAFLLMAAEEFAFRGYGFRQLSLACGPRTALVVSALAFGVYHLAQTGFGMWGIGAFWVVALPALGGLAFGIALLRTGSLAMPLGLHLGGNWVQASVLRLGDLGNGEPSAMFVASLTQPQAHKLWSPDFPSHLPYLLAMVAALLLISLWPTSSTPAAGIEATAAS
jgi:uncharacterized protein